VGGWPAERQLGGLAENGLPTSGCRYGKRQVLRRRTNVLANVSFSGDGSFADAKPAENAVQDVVGIDGADHLGKCVERQTNLQGD
jgi:hypothetical protein